MATLTGKLVSETYKALLKMIDNDILTESEKQISDGFGQGTGIFIDDNGFIRASVFKVTGGSSSQFLKADGSLDSNSYLTAAAASALYLTRTEADGLYLAIGSTTSAIAEGSRLYFTTGRVLATTLTGFVSTAGTVTAADSILTAINKIWWNIINGGGGGGGYVPYTGATQNLNLGTYGLISDFIQFNLAPTLIPTTAGTMAWNAADGTADLKMGGGNVTLQVGQEELVRVVNKTGVNLLEANYQAVRISGAQGNRLKVALAKADNDANSADTIGLVTETINNNLEGFVTAVGLVRNIDTTGDLQTETWADGDSLYLSATTAGKITNIKPVAPKHGVRLGYVVSAHKTQGQIYVKVDNGYELDELHNVKITTPLDKDVLFYDGPNNLWINKNIYSAINATAVGQALLAIKIAANTTPVTTKPRLIRINVDNTVSALEVGKQGYLPYYDATKFYPDSPIFVNSNGKVIVNGETGFYDFTVIGELKADNLYVNTFSKIIAETSNNSLSFNTYDGTDWIQNLRLFNDGTIKQLIVTNTLIGTTSTGILRAGTKADIETILGAPAISGSLTENYIPIATDVDSITDSIIYQDGTNLVINGTSSAYKLQVNGTFSADELYVFGTGRITPNLVSGYVTHSVINSSTFNNVLRLHKNQDIQQFKITNGIVYADDFGYLAKATSGQIIAGLGFVPYNSTNPDGFIAPGTFFATNPLIWDQFTNTISMSQASDLNNGWLSASDWTTFNNKGGGSVSSVSASVPTGFAISGSPITTSGTLAITFAAGYSLPTTIKQSNWDDAYTFVAAFPSQTGNAGKYLTTDGSSLSWGTVTAGVSSFNTRTGAVTLSSTDVTTALGYTPVTQARTLTINGTTYDLSADRAWTISAGSSARNVSTFTATAGQTTFTITGGYTPNLVDVFLNGVRLTGVDFTATNGTTIVLTEGVRVNDIIDVVNYLNAATLGITGSGTSGYLPKWTGTSVVSNSLIFDNGTNVGISIASPLSKLHISGQSGTTGLPSLLLYGESPSNGQRYGFNVSADQLDISALGSSARIAFFTGGAANSINERLRLTSSGNLGLGTTTPANNGIGETAFEIRGSVFPMFTVSTATNSLQMGIGGSATAYLNSTGAYSLSFGTNGFSRLQISSNGNISQFVNDGSISLYKADGTTLKASLANPDGSNTDEGALYLYKSNVTKVQIRANGTSYFTGGTVGIGTSSPSLSSGTGLVVQNSTYVQLRVQSGSSSAGIEWVSGTNYRYEVQVSNAGEWFVYNRTLETYRLMIKENGNVGINTTTPSGKLEVVGNNSSGSGNLFVGNSGALNMLYVSAPQFTVGINVQGGSENVRFYNSGTAVGTISTTGSSTSYNTSSDYRLKEDLKDIKGIELLSKINFYNYKWKSENVRTDGVIAHELQEILPYAVTGLKDGKDMQAVDYSKLTPVIGRAVQELDYKFETQSEKIARLETRVQQLEAK
jgi:hypothetical protein